MKTGLFFHSMPDKGPAKRPQRGAVVGLVLAVLLMGVCPPVLQGAVLLPEAVSAGADVRAAASKAKEAVAEHVVRVLVTAQPHDFSRPWSKRAPVARKAMGTVLSGERVLVTAEAVANATYIELESPDGESKQPAAVEHVDYEANLALLKPEGSGFLKGRKGLELSRLKAGDFFTVCQLEANGNLLLSRGQMNTAEVARYPLEEFAFLICRASCSLQMKDATLSLPVVLDGKLAGMVLRYDAPSSILDILPAPVIEHFLKDAADGAYQGFPRMGAAFASTRDPQLRRYLKLPSGNGGVLITQVSKGSPAEGAGLVAGDVLMEIAGKPVDADGNYRDEEYGRISLGHLVSTHHFEGEDLAVRILRGGEAKEVHVRLARRPVDQYVSEPYVIDRAPRYYVLGGLVLQELNRQYLREFGTDWARKAPMELIYLDTNQAEMEKMGRRKIVMISRVLPSNLTVGYEELRHVMVDAINGVRIQSLEDVPKALSATKDGLIKIELEHEPSLLYLDAKGVDQTAPAIQRAYGIPELSRLR
jgi:S1-C subfamily serine protease